MSCKQAVPWVHSGYGNTRERHSIDYRQPLRAATSPFPSTTSSQMDPYLGQTAYPPPPLYSRQQNSQTTQRSNIHFSQNKNHTRSTSHSTDEPIPGPSQLYPAHEQQFYSVSYCNRHQGQMPSPAPLIPVPPKPPALQETRQNGGHALLHPTLSRSFTSPPPVPPKPALLPPDAYPGNSWPVNMPSTAGEVLRPPGAIATDQLQEEEEEEEDGDDLAVAMALSKDESEKEVERMQELVRLEEEELERALAASMLTANGGYDGYEFHLQADPPNLASSAIESSLLAASPDVHPQSGPSLSSSEAPAKDTSSRVQKTDEPDPEDNAFRVPEGTGPTLTASPPRMTKRRSPSRSVTSSDYDQVEIYPPVAVGQTSIAPSFPKPEIPKIETNDDGGDDSDDGGSKGTREGLSVSAPIRTESQRRSRCSPVSASFIDLSYSPYIDEDEAFARRLAEEEKESSQRLTREEAAGLRQKDNLNGQKPSECNLSRNSSATSASTRPCSDTSNDLPTYDDVMSISTGPASRRSTLLPEVTVDPPTSPEKAGLVRNSSATSASIARASSQFVVSSPSNGLSAVPLPPDGPQRVIGRVSSLSALIPVRPLIEDGFPPSPVDDLATPTNHLSINPRAGHPPTTSMKGTDNASDMYSGPSRAGTFNANLFIDAELLHGVSIQFTPPVISAKLMPMQGQIPTLISLPYGRCPPLHFQASSWRHMLKLMARLSSTKMEPSIEAMAVIKNEVLKLRTVIQFIKPHHMSDEWRTILWFTIDYPIPPNIPNAAKHSSANVNNLPFSYTLSSIPAVLKDASDTSLSKTYTIPTTSSVPYPSLPITFPNLALYLQAALDDSRMQSESSSLRKLAKMVQTCYPNDLVPRDLDEPENSRGVSGLFKRVMGRGGKKKGRGGNEDTYDLVTPFVPEEWG